jgi:hypothetical protein
MFPAVKLTGRRQTTCETRFRQEGEAALTMRDGKRGPVTGVLAGLVVVAALLAPNDLSRLSLGTFVSIPVEALLAVALLLLLPRRARPPTAVVLGVALGLLTIMKLADVGFMTALGRPFNPLLDWSLLGSGLRFVRESFGLIGAIGAVVGAALVVAAVLLVMTVSVKRLTRMAVWHNVAASRAVVVLAVVWVTCALPNVQLAPGVRIAGSATAFLFDRARHVSADLRDQQVFAAEAAVDAFRTTPSDQLLTALRGKDVLLAFVESYGRSAIEDPGLSPQVDAVLAAGNRKLAAAGFASRSAFLTSSTAGGGSWLAHGTLLSGLWIDNNQRDHDLVTSDRLTLSKAFQRAGWRTAAVMPGNTSPWPEGAFFGYDKVYNAEDLSYQGPKFSWSPMPDQFALMAYERQVHGTQQRAPSMAEVVLTSSHAPWAPLPRLIDWGQVGDGSVFDKMSGKGYLPEAILTRDRSRVRADYRRSIEYSLDTLISYIQTYGNDDLVVVFLGDHQPSPVVTGQGASRDVPITIVAHDKAVLNQIAGWEWQPGLKPGPDAPVWRMDAFRDHFLTAFGPPAQTQPLGSH